VVADSSFYSREIGAHGQERFFASESTRGPWSNDHQHAGPPAALLARAIARAEPNPQAMFVTRVTLELLKPIPIAAPLEIDVDVLSAGRTVDRIAAVLRSGDDSLIVAVGLRMRVREIDVPILTHDDLAGLRPLEQARSWEFPFFQHERGYHSAMDIRIAAGKFGAGNMAAWIRPRIPLLADEATDALQRVLICADAGHGIGSGLDTREFGFVNPDLSVHLHRLPVDEWICMDARTFTQPLGIGLCRTRLLDRHGEFGIGLQAQVLTRANRV
jgi:hypothetical protein